jgi:hypothetical protein
MAALKSVNTPAVADCALCRISLICCATAFIGAVPTTIDGHDIFVPLEVGWRVMNGQRPHVDFTSAYGPLLFMLSAMG